MSVCLGGGGGVTKINKQGGCSRWRAGGFHDDFSHVLFLVPICSTYPVPHCSTLVMLSCRRLLSHATSSCLYGASASASVGVARLREAQALIRQTYLDSPIFVFSSVCCLQARGTGEQANGPDSSGDDG